jgi:DNA repair exonuclease SbcCD nuclease subunit
MVRKKVCRHERTKDGTMIVFADLHLREQSEQTCFRVLEAVERMALEDDKRIVFCGDWWHLRYQVNVRLLNRVAELMRRWADLGLELDLVPGNHDQVDVAGRNALEVFEGDNCAVHTDPGISADGQFGFVPYRKDLVEQFDALVAVAGEVDPGGIIFAHLPVRGSAMNNGHKCEDGIQISSHGGITQWLVLGHYHKRQSGQGWSYVGSPYQTSFGEAGNVCGVFRIDPVLMRSEWTPLDVGAPTHHVLKWDPAKDEKPPPRPQQPNAKVRLDIEASHEMIVGGKFKNVLKSAGLADVEIQVIPTRVDREHKFAVAGGETLLQAAERFAAERLDPKAGQPAADALEAKRSDELMVPGPHNPDVEQAMDALRRWAE